MSNRHVDTVGGASVSSCPLENLLRHLAVVVDGAAPARREGQGIPSAPAADLLALFDRLVRHCFDRIRDLAVVSLFSPELQSLASSSGLAGEELAAVEQGLSRLADSARAVEASFRVIGRAESLLPPWPSLLESAVVPGGGARTVNLFMGYSSREEIAAAAERCLAEGLGEDLSEEAFSSRLLTSGQPDPDLIILAGGLPDPKDFLLWQASYAEIWHHPGNGLHFDETALSEALASYMNRQRRFGRV